MIDWGAWVKQIWAYVAAAGVSTGLLLLILSFFVLLGFLFQKVNSLLGARVWGGLVSPISTWKVILALLIPIGVAFHESCHALFCLIFRIPIKEIKFFHLPNERGAVGHVRHGKMNLRDFAACFFIGAGPMLIGIPVLVGLTFWLMPEVRIGTSPLGSAGTNDLASATAELTLEMLRGLLQPKVWCRWQSYVWLTAMFILAPHLDLSPSDLEHTGCGAIFLVPLLFILDLAVIPWFDPAKLLLHRWGGALVTFWAGAVLLLLVLLVLAAVLSLPIFCRGASDSPKKG